MRVDGFCEYAFRIEELRCGRTDIERVCISTRQDQRYLELNLHASLDSYVDHFRVSSFPQSQTIL